MHILVVDDENLIEKMIGRQLQKAGYQYVSFHDSEQAMEFLMGNHDRLDLAILDVRMPVMTGVEMANEIYKIESTLPIILITGMLDDIEVDGAVNIKNVLHKPIPRDELLDAVRKSLYL